MYEQTENFIADNDAIHNKIEHNDKKTTETFERLEEQNKRMIADNDLMSHELQHISTEVERLKLKKEAEKRFFRYRKSRKRFR